MSTSSPQVFISFTSADKSYADTISSRLTAAGIAAYHYSESSRSGAWHLNQLKTLRKCDVAIFLITPASSGSSACLDEAQRIADPTQDRTTPIPVVLGSWDHEESDLWLLLGKWHGIMARNNLDDSELNRLIALTKDKILQPSDASLSTGHALDAVKEDLITYIHSVGKLELDDLVQEATKLQRKYRGSMVSFLQFTYLDREFLAAELISDHDQRLAYLASYLESFFDAVVRNTLTETAATLAHSYQLNDVLVLSEYSRVILRSLEVLSQSRPEVFRSLDIYIVSRTGMLLVATEPTKMAERLTELGARPFTLSFADWIEFLRGARGPQMPRKVDKMIFGVEAFSMQGDVLYPQIVKELDIIRTRKTLEGPISESKIIAAGESYKICRDDKEVSKIIVDPHYSVISAATFDAIVTDGLEIANPTDQQPWIRLVANIKSLADAVRELHWPGGTPLPVWNIPTPLRRSARVIATDVDGTLTYGSAMGLGAVQKIASLAQAGIKVVMVTGRSAGWCCAFAHYIPGVFAVIAENGAVVIDAASGDSAPILLDGLEDEERTAMRGKVEACLNSLQSEYPFLQLSSDNFSRLTDIAFLVDPRIDPSRVQAVASSFGVQHTYSSVHHHLSTSKLDKATGLTLALRDFFGTSSTELKEATITVGDSFNDGPLFDRSLFATSVGVRGILPHLDRLGERRPTYVTLSGESSGFVELAELLLT